MLGYWKWLHKILSSGGKTDVAKILCWFGFELAIIIGITYILVTTISIHLAIIVLVINFILLLGHMRYLMV